MTVMFFENLKFKVLDCQKRNIFLLHFMQLFYSAVKAAGKLISHMLTRMRLRSPKLCICFCVSGCMWLFKPQENQPELNKTRHSHPSQSLPITADDRQNADTTLLSNWILDIIYSCFNMSGKSCGNNTQSLTFVLVLAPLFPVCWWIDGWMKRLNVIWYKSCVFSVTCGQANISTQRNAR